MNSILRPSTPPIALICSIASFSACTEPVSLMAMVPVTECRMPTLTVVSVTARPEVLTSAVGKLAAVAGALKLRPMLAANSQGVNRWPRLNRRAGLRMKELLQARGPTVDDPQGLATCRWRREALCLEPYEQLGRRWWPRPWLARTNRTVCQVQSNGCARDFEPGRNWCGKQR